MPEATVQAPRGLADLFTTEMGRAIIQCRGGTTLAQGEGAGAGRGGREGRCGCGGGGGRSTGRRCWRALGGELRGDRLIGSAAHFP